MSIRYHTSARIEFDRSPDELTTILSVRVEYGLRDGVIDSEGIRHIADAAHGDARVAIGALRTAARNAQKEGLTSILMDPVGFVPGVEYEHETVENHLDSHSKVDLTQKLKEFYPELEEE